MQNQMCLPVTLLTSLWPHKVIVKQSEHQEGGREGIFTPTGKFLDLCTVQMNRGRGYFECPWAPLHWTAREEEEEMEGVEVALGVSPVLWGFWQISRSQLLLVKTSASGVKGWMKWVFTTSEKSQEFPRAPTSARWMFFLIFLLSLCFDTLFFLSFVPASIFVRHFHTFSIYTSHFFFIYLLSHPVVRDTKIAHCCCTETLNH